MPRDPNHRFATDSRESSILASLALDEPGEDIAREALAILHYRGTRLEFEIARKLASDIDRARRSVAADILGQLGWDERTCLEESVDVLLHLLDDSDSGVADRVLLRRRQNVRVDSERHLDFRVPEPTLDYVRRNARRHH